VFRRFWVACATRRAGKFVLRLLRERFRREPALQDAAARYNSFL